MAGGIVQGGCLIALWFSKSAKIFTDGMNSCSTNGMSSARTKSIHVKPLKQADSTAAEDHVS